MVYQTYFFRNKEIRIVGLIAFTTGLVQSSFVFIPTYATSLFGVEPSVASFMLLPIVVTTAVGSPVFAGLIDSYGAKIIIFIGIVLTSVGLYLLHCVIDSMFFLLIRSFYRAWFIPIILKFFEIYQVK